MTQHSEHPSEPAPEQQRHTRRAFLIRAAAVTGGAVTLPILAEAPAKCEGHGANARAAAVEQPAVPDPVSEAQLREVTDAILCEGKCGKTVYMGELADACPIATQMKLEAANYLAQGMTPAQVLDEFVADFGEDVLAAPPKSGINMLPWMLPIGGLALGIAAVAKALANWRNQERPAAAMRIPETDAEMRTRIDDEVQKGL